MATLDSLKLALRQKTKRLQSSSQQPLSDTHYSAGFDILVQDSGWALYQDFIIPQLTEQLLPLLESRTNVSILEIGPGPKSILGHLPAHLSRKIGRFTAFEPNSLFASRLKEWFCSDSKAKFPQFGLENLPLIHRTSFVLKSGTSSTNSAKNDGNEKFDVIIFCHSMYGMKPKRKFIEQALEMLVEGGLVVVFHRDGSLHLDGLVCHRTAFFPLGVIRVKNENETLDSFASFVAGYVDGTNKIEWRETCRALSGHKDAHPDYLFFSAPEIMATFTHSATAVPKLTNHMPAMEEERLIKNWEARLQGPAAIVRPTTIGHIQQCIKWAREHNLNLAIIGGGHSGHCLRPNVVSIDMGAFDNVQVLTAEKDMGPENSSNPNSRVIAGAGCQTGNIIRKAAAKGLTVPLGSRPSVGAGLWLAGGIGHLTRLHGLACDAIIGAVVVSVDSGQILYIGCVPPMHIPAGAVRPECEDDLLWAIKGAGTNFGIVISITFKAQVAPTYAVRNWILPVHDENDAQLKLGAFEHLVAKLPRDCSADAYLYWDHNKLCLGVTEVQTSASVETATLVGAIFVLEDSFNVVDGVGLFETDMYISGMHGGHGGGKTYSFKRCLFFNNIGRAVVDGLMTAVDARPTPYCYFHFLHGGGVMKDIAVDATAFGCRDWEFACVITGVWLREQDGADIARAAVQWVYDTIGDLIPLSSGAYSADLGPDPRDVRLAEKAFGLNMPRLARLKGCLDPGNILAYACPLSKAILEELPGSVFSLKPKLIVIVTGESCAGKDHCAEIWQILFTTVCRTSRVVSISDATKREYALATDVDLDRLIHDRAYKEQHRPALTVFFQDQVLQRPQLPEEHFMDVIQAAADVDVLIITGMRDEMPLARFSHLVPGSRLLEVRIKASKKTRHARRGCHAGDLDGNDNKDSKESNDEHHSGLIFDNETAGNEAAVRSFAEKHLLSFFHRDLQRLAKMVPLVPGFPSPHIDFRDVLNIPQHREGLNLCIALLQTHFTGDWTKVEKIVCCEAGGFVFGSPLAMQINVPLVLIRKAGKLPPPIVSVTKYSSHISGLHSDKEEAIEMARDAISGVGSVVVVVDDVLATGKTLCAMLELLVKAGVDVDNISVMVVAEFPLHGGRNYLHQKGFGGVKVQSLLLFDSA